MVIKIHFSIIVIFLIALLSMQMQCRKVFGCDETVYSFGLAVKTYTDRDSIPVGDTIWIEIDEPINLKDSKSGNTIDYSGAKNLGSVITFSKLSALQQFTVKAANKFDYLLIKGTRIASCDEDVDRQYIFAEENSRYMFKLGIVAKEVGTYGVIISNAANVYRKNDKCTKASFSIHYNCTMLAMYSLSEIVPLPYLRFSRKKASSIQHPASQHSVSSIQYPASLTHLSSLISYLISHISYLDRLSLHLIP